MANEANTASKTRIISLEPASSAPDLQVTILDQNILPGAQLGETPGEHEELGDQASLRHELLHFIQQPSFTIFLSWLP